MKLTRKQKAFADTLLDNPKMSATQAALKTYGKPDKPATYNTARDIASENLSKPHIQLYLQNHDYESQSTIVEMMKQREDKRLAFDAAKDIQDRVHGRATQRVEQHTEGITLHIDLTQSLNTES
jgi:phage terminase small subunit